MAIARTGNRNPLFLLPVCVGVLVLFTLPPAGIAEPEITGVPEIEVTSEHQAIREWTHPPKGTSPLRQAGKDRITLKLNQVAVADVIRLIAEYADLNVLIDKDVQEVMTVKLTNVTWEEALNTLLEANRLSARQIGAVIKVAPTEKIQKEEQELLKARRDKEVLEDLIVRTVTPNFLTAKSLLPQVEPLLGPRGSVRENERTNALIVKDIPSKIQEIEQLLRELDRKVPQVLIEAKIVMMRKKALEELGVNWGGVAGWTKGGKYGGVRGALDQATGLPGLLAGEAVLPSNSAVNVPVSSPLGALGVGVGKLGSYNLDLQISALEDRNLVKLLSCPKLLVLDNQAATIGQGKEVPYQSTTDYYTSTQFKKVELSLEVTPHITSVQSISLDIHIKNDTISEYTVDNLPVINTQHITTTLLLQDGETAVIGGVVQKERRKTNRGVPYLSRIPLLGWLFKGKVDHDEEEELVIFLTPNVS